MRFDVWGTALALIFVVGLNAGAQDRKADSARSAEAAAQASSERYLELARATAVDPNAPSWMDSLLLDPRAHAVNDLLTVAVVESVNASGTADSSVNKDGSNNVNFGSILGKMPKTPQLFDTSSSSKFKGGGSTTRTDALTANLTVRVSEVLPNGNLVLEGAREVQINGERQLFVLTGMVRPVDISPNNVVQSTAIAQLHVQYVGSGLLKDSLSPGWLARLLNKVF
jgi:flagellar L-ring protein precursor FlgH